jgi:hypothetical protein
MASALQNLDRGLTALEAQTATVRDNPVSLEDAGWQQGTAGALAAVRSSGEAMPNYPDTVPSSLQGLHELLSSLGSDASAMADAYEAAADTRDPAAVARVAESARAIAARRRAATERVQALGFG